MLVKEFLTQNCKNKCHVQNKCEIKQKKSSYSQLNSPIKELCDFVKVAENIYHSILSESSAVNTFMRKKNLF